jgi:hypothetical protein
MACNIEPLSRKFNLGRVTLKIENKAAEVLNEKRIGRPGRPDDLPERILS